MEKEVSGPSGADASGTRSARREDITRLPKWAQELIRTLERQREDAVKALNDWTDAQTPQAFFVDEWVCAGEEQGPSSKRRYVEGRNISAVHAGIRLDIHLRNEGIQVWWEAEKGNRLRYVGIVPTANQQMLIPKLEAAVGPG